MIILVHRKLKLHPHQLSFVQLFSVCPFVSRLCQQREILGSFESKECWYGGTHTRNLRFISMGLLGLMSSAATKAKMDGVD